MATFTTTSKTNTTTAEVDFLFQDGTDYLFQDDSDFVFVEAASSIAWTVPSENTATFSAITKN